MTLLSSDKKTIILLSIDRGDTDLPIIGIMLWLSRLLVSGSVGADLSAPSGFGYHGLAGLSEVSSVAFFKMLWSKHLPLRCPFPKSAKKHPR